MPPHRTSGKLTPQAQHALIRKYHISIQGPIRRQDWPQKYASIFSLVRDMERVSYDQYKEIDFADDSARRVAMFNLYNRVERLVAQAQKLREALDNEETWRLKTENLILERFETEVDCHVCGDRRWISDFQATCNCPTSMAQLEDRRRSRKLCQCSEYQRAKLLAEHMSHISFVTKGSCTFVDNSMPEIQNNILSRHRPDRVVGLGQTPELAHLLAANPRVLATVNGDDGDMFFPFLVLEAKSEKNSVGFESIERQTVFPIRAMLGLQRALQEASGVQTDPLVWFLANRGDEWRIYGCVPSSHRIQIIDLWHGSILRHDSALQLLLVVDLLCDWARDIYMDRVVAALQHLAGPEIPAIVSQDSFEVVAPSATAPRDPPTTQHQLDSETSRTPPAAPHVGSAEPQVKSEATDTVIEPVPVRDTEDEDAFEDIIPESSQVQPGPQKGESGGPYVFDSEHWQQYIALRAGSSIQLLFRCLSLPESVYGLSAILKHIDNDADVSQTAHKLLVLFQPMDPLIVDTYFLNRIRRSWGAVERPNTAGNSRRIYACLHWRASFNYADWMLTKELAVITASEAAMSFLISLANMSRVYGSLPGKSTKIAKHLIRPLRYMPLPELVQAAAKDQFLYLKPSDGKVTSKGWWEDREKADFSTRLWKCRDAPLLRQCYDSSVSKSFHQWSNVDPPVKLPRALRLEDDTAEYDGVALLRIPPEVRVTKPEYCIFSYQTQIAPNPQRAGRKMLSLLRDAPDVFFGTRRRLGGQDQLYLRALAKLLIDIPEDKW
ncbi:uncharacterized protein BDV14DRAFT_174059 [Aspergillus stella-maris]|uniref:uncharacterized protein n=1 Tax=Aspergillus stella-maris TaxID=1810926 RepID=UPI003CCDC812